MTNCQCLIAYDEVHCCFDHRALLIEASGHVVCLCIVIDNLLAVFAEDIDVVITDEVVDFNVCTVSCAKCHRTV